MYKQLNMKLKNDVARIEFWIVTGIILTSLLFTIGDEIRVTDLKNNYLSGLIVPILFNSIVTFISYLLLCFYVEPAFEKENQPAASNTLFVFIFIGACTILGIINLYFAALLAIKILLLLFNRNTRNKENALYYEAALLTASWILLVVGSLYLSLPEAVKFYIIFAGPAAIIIYLYSVHRLLPKLFIRNKGLGNYAGRMVLLTLFSCLILTGIGFCFEYPNRMFSTATAIFSLHVYTDGNQIAVIVIGNFFTQLLLVMPISWNIHKSRNARQDEEIKTLKTELGKSDANLNFLKSQINPHFLFNALNTLYGTALQENAERTGEGIQKLGDMMRFMLQENTQDTIRLSRDIDYLNNYILLQKLRTSTSEDVTIETQIEEYTGDLMITPMLLIPFVENAFKHGISLQNPSHIKVTLQTKDNTLYFDVHNSIHIRPDNDPEKGQSGIGLENVKQRLSLLYPDRYDLVIRQNAKEFFIHLTVQLISNSYI
ncbi:Histidine kinase [Mucilaginibacter pineti]|uniref:Histidine kinase n=1 Tax=Mucilaginibacter pineti TaxID=1391627 RepID=A0A1G7AXF1_9SPHI|nr:histidine kinase [Mucilaginibacter pineti]SDE18636.1 Histidine kinase [Mucilaginibacter pineti]